MEMWSIINIINNILLVLTYSLPNYWVDLVKFIVLFVLMLCCIGIIILCVTWIFYPHFMPLEKVRSFEVFRAKLASIILLFGWYLFYLCGRLLIYIPLIISNINQYVGFTMFVLLFIVTVCWIAVQEIKGAYNEAKKMNYNSDSSQESKDIIKTMFEGKRDFMFTIVQILFWIILPCTIFAIVYKIMCHKGVVDTLVLFISIASLLTTVFALWSSIRDRRDLGVLDEKIKNFELLGKKGLKNISELESDNEKKDYN